MTDGRSGPVGRPSGGRGRWAGFVAALASGGRQQRSLQQPDNPRHRVRVEYDGHTVLVHLSDEDGAGWTTLAVDRPSRAWSVAQRPTQVAAATAACSGLYD